MSEVVTSHVASESEIGVGYKLWVPLMPKTDNIYSVLVWLLHLVSTQCEDIYSVSRTFET